MKKFPFHPSHPSRVHGSIFARPCIGSPDGYALSPYPLLEGNSRTACSHNDATTVRTPNAAH